MPRTVFAVLPLIASSALGADSAGWKLSFSDTFDRAEIGPDWITGAAEIVDGRLRFGTDGEHLALIHRHFAADVRVEFEAQALPDRAPCDLSIGLGCGKTADAYEFHYLLAFGGNFNSINQIQGGRDMKWVQDWGPRRRIQPQTRHHVCATKEGTTLTLEVDGEVLLTTTDRDPLGGPGYDMVGLVTWNGMLADNVRVYERRVPHPDTPRYVTELRGLALQRGPDRMLSAPAGAGEAVLTAVSLFNAGKPRAAEEVFLSAPDMEVRAAGAAWSVGHQYYEAGARDFARVGDMLVELARAHSDDERLQDYGELGRRLRAFRVERFEGQPSGELAAGAVLAMGEAHNPVFDQAKLLKARFLRAHAMEGGGKGMDVPLRMFNELKALYPDNPNLRELTGEKIPWGNELIDDDSAVPRWARYLRELYARQAAVLHWWFTQRQAPDGQLGGGWGDDCEILRDWGPLAVVSTGDPAIVEGIERLCQGIWGAAIHPRFGFGSYGDAEHASEPSADTQPTMMLLRWGDPLYIERNMLAGRTIRDIYMGVDATGHYRFRSGFYGDDQVGRTPQQEGDVHYNARAMKHLQQLALWGNAEARRVYLSWVDGWLQQTMRAYPDKPASIIPQQLFFPSGTIIPPDGTTFRDWLSTNAGDPDEPPGMGSMIQGAFLAAYRLTGDRAYLEPMHRYMRWTSTGPLAPASSRPAPGSPAWVLRGQQGDTHTDTVASFRWLTGDRTVDEYLLRFATPYQRYMATNDLEGLVQCVEAAAKAMRTNFRLMTEEQLQTDRAGLPATRETIGAYTGAIHTWRDSLMPTMAVTWEAPDTDFAALVVASTQERLRVWVYSFHDQPVRFGLRLWQLRPGEYELMHGTILAGESTNLRYEWSEPEVLTVRRRADTCAARIPGRTAYAVDLRLLRPVQRPELLPDVGIADRDIAVAPEGPISVTVHSLGSAAIPDMDVVLEVPEGSGWRDAGRQRLGELDAPGLDPVSRTLTFPRIQEAVFRVRVDPRDRVDELCESNNAAVWRRRD